MSTTYRTKAGDTWDLVALTQLGDERRATELHEANPEHVWTIRFKAGVELTVPDVTTATPTTAPPWRRS